MSRFLSRCSPLLMIALLWAMVIAPVSVARCVHVGGYTHLHAVGAACGDDDAPGGHEDHDASVSGDCAAFAAPDAMPGESPLIPPPPGIAPAPEPVIRVAPLAACAAAPLAGRPQGPPASPVRRTHGRGALPLLT